MGGPPSLDENKDQKAIRFLIQSSRAENVKWVRRPELPDFGYLQC